MNIDTLKEKAVFGTKAIADNASVSYSTDYQSMTDSLDKISFKEPVTTESSFRQIDFSAEKKMDVCRKINKMMGNY